jgi:hypothetical protein
MGSEVRRFVAVKRIWRFEAGGSGFQGSALSSDEFLDCARLLSGVEVRDWIPRPRGLGIGIGRDGVEIP